ncbi:MAG: hypothetical protein M0R73_04710 [Dehalococcoidia bacterium]|nr:hypothetical protein [Dehalococcoidia bacterium]
MDRTGMHHRYLLLVAVGAGLLLSACSGQSGSAGEWPDYFSIEDLVRDSELVVIASLVGERSK